MDTPSAAHHPSPPLSQMSQTASPRSTSSSTSSTQTTGNPKIVRPIRKAGKMKNKWAMGFASLCDDYVEPTNKLTHTTPFKVIPPDSSLDVDCSASALSPAPLIDSDISTAIDVAAFSPKREKCTAVEPLDVSGDIQIVSKLEASGNDAQNDNDDGRIGGLPTNMRTEWVGTSQFHVDDNVATQVNGHLDSLINWRQAIVHDIQLSPYDPLLYLDLNLVDCKLGFTDIAVSDAHKSLMLIHAARTITSQNSIHPRGLYTKVRNSVLNRLRYPYLLVLNDVLEGLLLKAQRALINALLGCAAFWDGSAEAKKALKFFPGDAEILETADSLKAGFVDRQNGLLELGAKGDDLVLRTRIGKVYQKRYPWMEKDLFIRKAALMREINKNFATGSSEVRPVVFGPSPTIASIPREDGDLGPLGIFATRDIKRGELVMVDQSITGISNVPSSKLQHCDACHASLNIPFLRPDEVIRPACCKYVAYCSHSCYETASKGYHKVLCGKDFDWLYNHSGPKLTQARAGNQWVPVMFLRLIAIIVADRRAQAKVGKKPVHPLAHPLVSRMSANYSSPEKLHPDLPSDWQFFDNVVAPTRILMMLGIDVFAEPDFSQETIQTIYWRIENNASMSTVNLSLSAPRPAKSSPASNHLHLPPQSNMEDEGALSMKCINSSYLFFNHSCEPNVSWHGAVPSPWAGIEWLIGYGGEILRPGCSAVFCKASRDIAKGEEMKISYVGNPMGGDESGGSNNAELCGRAGKRLWLRKWFEGGCGCGVCVKENLAERMKKENIERGEVERMKVQIEKRMAALI